MPVYPVTAGFASASVFLLLSGLRGPDLQVRVGHRWRMRSVTLSNQYRSNLMLYVVIQLPCDA
jgi:hypothetical protein